MIGWLWTLPHCQLFGKPLLSALHVFGDIGVFLAYMMIPVTIEIVRARRQIPFSFLAILFAAFIFLCGVGHLFTAIATISGSESAYWIEGTNKALTAIISLLTAYYAILIIPKLCSIPSAAQWDEAMKTIALYRDAEKWRQFGKPKNEP